MGDRYAEGVKNQYSYSSEALRKIAVLETGLFSNEPIVVFENLEAIMLRSSAHQTPNNLDILKPENPVMRALKAFWQFSVYYGKFVSTPPEKRRSIS